MFNTVKAGIMSVYNSSVSTATGGLKNLLGDSFFFEEANERTPEPYAVYHLSFPDTSKDSVDEFEVVIMQLDIYDKSESSQNIGALAIAAQKLFTATKDLILLPESMYVTRAKRDFVKFIPRIDLVWTAVLQFRINIQTVNVIKLITEEGSFIVDENGNRIALQ